MESQSREPGSPSRRHCARPLSVHRSEWAKTAPEPTEYVLETIQSAFARTGLKSASVFKMGKLATLHRLLIVRRLGQATPALQEALDVALKRAVGLV